MEIDWSLVLKVAGILVSAFFGVYALLHDYRDDAGKVTKQGRVAIGGIFLGAIIGAMATILDEMSSRASTTRQLRLLSEQLERTDVAIDRIDRVANRFVIEEVTLRMDIGSAILTSRVLKTAEFLRGSGNLDCHPEDNDLGAAAAIRFALPPASAPCIDSLRRLLDGGQLPAFRFDVMSNWHGDTEAFFRVAASDRLPMNQNTDARFYAWNDANVVALELDDVPSRFRTVSILAIEDFAGRELFAEISDWGFIRPLEDVSVRLQSIDIDLADGRDMQIQLSDPRADVAGPWWHAEFRFPETREGVAALVAESMIAPSDADR